MLKSGLMHKFRKITLILMLFVLVGIAFGSGFLARSAVAASELSLLSEAFQLLEAHYIDALPDSLILQRGMVRGMLNALEDPFTSFSEPQEHTIQADTLAGEYGGIGALVTTDGSGNYFLAPFDDGPAADAGIIAGAQLLAIEGRPVQAGDSIDSVVSRLRGFTGTIVNLRIRQPDATKATALEIMRVDIPLPSVAEYVLPGYEQIGVISISNFSEATPQELDHSIETLLSVGVEKLILDLRNNGGGLLESAVQVSRRFLEGGIIVYEERRGQVQNTHEVHNPGEYLQVPIVVVVDGTTVSAAEVVAAALQANNRARLIGTATFGKGSVQAVVELSDGSSMRITSARWLTPDGEIIDGIGLQPDISLDPEVAGSEQAIIKAAQLLDEELKINE